MSVRRAAAVVAPALLFLTLAAGPMMLGGTPGWATAILGTLAGLTCCAAALTARAERSLIGPRMLGAIGFVTLAWTILQGIALPRALVGLLQPEAVEMSDGAAALLGAEPPDWIALSLAPVATRGEILKGSAMLAVFFAASVLCALGRRRQVLMAVAASVLVMAGTAFVHLALGADRVFGVYAVADWASPLPAPLVNNNALSGFFGLGVPLLAGLALDAADVRERAAWLAGAALATGGAILALSRGGLASLMLGVVVLGVMVVVARRDHRRHVGIVALTGVLGLAAALALYAGAAGLMRQFEDGGFGKLALAAEGLGLALDHPWIGVGRGGFSTAFVWEHGTRVRSTHPENFLVQWASEWGIPFAAALCAALVWTVGGALPRARSWAHRGALAALVAIAAHELVDFATELPGVAVVVSALVAAVVAPSRGSRAGPKPARSALFRPALVAGLVSLTLAVALGWNLDAIRAPGLRASLEDQMRRRDRDGFAATVRRAVTLHPGEPAFVLLGGAEAVRRDDVMAIRWLNRAMVLAPGWSAPHEETARWLMRQRRYGQALLEVWEAAARDGHPQELACAILARSHRSVDVLVRAAGDEPAGRRFLDQTAQCLEPTSEPALAIDRHLLRHGIEGARMRDAERALAREDWHEALRSLEPLAQSADERVIALRARAWVGAGEPRRAIALLDRAEGRDEGPRLLLRLADACVAAGDGPCMRDALERARVRASGSAREIASLWSREGALEERLGNDGRALAAYERAHRLDGGSEGLLALARLSESLGDHLRAFQAYTELCAESDPDSAHCTARDRLRARMVESPSGRAQPSSEAAP